MTNLTLFPNPRLIGFDQIADMMDRVTKETIDTYPPYDVEKVDDNTYTITLALAGFTKDMITIETEGEQLRIEGSLPSKEDTKSYIHKGIAQRAFKRKFQMAPHVTVHSAKMQDGLLSITLVRDVPEKMKPRKIELQE